MTEHIEGRLNEIKGLCDKSLASNDDPVLRQVKDKCDQCVKYCRDLTETTNVDGRKDLLKQYAQVVLDYTYIDETKLVNEDFPRTSSIDRIKDIFSWIDTIEQSTKNCLPQLTMVECLGEDIVECIHWRKGALLYMLCSTIKQDDDRKDEVNSDFLENVKQGIEHLQEMLKVQNNVTEWNGDAHAVDLANMGVFSDTHLLCMMYAGEMCYWYCQLQGESVSEFNAKTIGQDLLSKYIKVVNSPLIMGWSSERAEQYLKFLSECS